MYVYAQVSPCACDICRLLNAFMAHPEQGQITIDAGARTTRRKHMNEVLSALLPGDGD